MKENGKRRIGLLFDPHIFEQFCKNGKFTIKNSPIPKGAKFITAHYSEERGSFIVYFDHKSFDTVPLGSIVPIKHMEANKKLTEIYYEATE